MNITAHTLKVHLIYSAGALLDNQYVLIGISYGWILLGGRNRVVRTNLPEISFDWPPINDK
jgi:hypothetical protein